MFREPGPECCSAAGVPPRQAVGVCRGLGGGDSHSWRGAWLMPPFTVPGTSGLPPRGYKSIPYKSYRLSLCPCSGGGESPATSRPPECLVALPGEGPWRPDSTDPRILQRLPFGSRRACSVCGWSAVDSPRRPPLGSDGRLQDSRIGSASGPNLVMFCHPSVDPSPSPGVTQVPSPGVALKPVLSQNIPEGGEHPRGPHTSSDAEGWECPTQGSLAGAAGGSRSTGLE